MSLSKEAVLEKMKQAHVVVLNVLPPEEFRKLHIRGSHNIPLSQDYGAFVQEVEKRYGKERPFITYCSGIASAAAANAARILRGHGFTVDDYPGGTEEWHQTGGSTGGILAQEADLSGKKP